MSSSPDRSRWCERIQAIALLLVAMVLLVACTSAPRGAVTSGALGAPTSTSGAPDAPTPICNQAILDSPWSYDGAAGTYTTSGSPAGLPTFGAQGTDFPSATKIIVVPAGNNTAAADTGTYQVTNAVVYFEPGMHNIEDGIYLGHNSDYVGGYTAAAGKAILNGVDGATNGTGHGGNAFGVELASSNSTADNTYEYLTIENYTSTESGSVMGNINGGGASDGDTYKYDTIGPNEYGRVGSNSPPATGESSGGGYGIDMGNYTTIEYSCLTRNAQGAFNDGGIDDILADNEISWNGLGIYPDSSGPGGSPHACGCSGGGKLFQTINAEVVNNYVHNNYSTAIWFDFNNTGTLISHNYIASNWAAGIIVEGSFNADISDNTLVGNGWASDGPWPAGIGGRSCFGGASCTDGGGLSAGAGGFPFGAIYLPNSGGNANLSTISVPPTVAVPGCRSNCHVTSRYRGEFLVEGNVLTNNFGGVVVYTDTNRYPGNIDEDSACSIPLGSLNQWNNSTYYPQTSELITKSDTSISGTAVSSAGGTFTICSNYGASGGGQGGGQNTVTAPSAGMDVFDQATGNSLGTVASVTSAHSFTLSVAPANGTYHAGDALLLDKTGGCGPADYYGGGLGVNSGVPSAAYWYNCIWGSHNVTVSRNIFAMNASVVSNCTIANFCGITGAFAFVPGIPKLMQFWGNTYPSYIAKATGGLGNVWSDNAYHWSGGGAGAWRFDAGLQNTLISQSAWQTTDGQDAGSTFGS